MDKLKDNLTSSNTIYARSHGTLIDEQFTQVAVGNDSDYLLIKVLTNTNMGNVKEQKSQFYHQNNCNYYFNSDVRNSKLFFIATTNKSLSLKLYNLRISLDSSILGTF